MSPPNGRAGYDKPIRGTQVWGARQEASVEFDRLSRTGQRAYIHTYIHTYGRGRVVNTASALFFALVHHRSPNNVKCRPLVSASSI
jgi:hypothetical protein